MLTAVDYWPSSSDCKELIAQHIKSVERNVWRGIRPLYSTRTEVERVLGKPGKQSLNKTYAYDTHDETVDILYSEGPCTPSVVGKWNVEADTVLRVTIYPQRTVLIAALGLNVEEYHRTPDSHIPNWFFSSISASWWVMVQFEWKDK